MNYNSENIKIITVSFIITLFFLLIGGIIIYTDEQVIIETSKYGLNGTCNIKFISVFRINDYNSRATVKYMIDKDMNKKLFLQEIYVRNINFVVGDKVNCLYISENNKIISAVIEQVFIHSPKSYIIFSIFPICLAITCIISYALIRRNKNKYSNIT